MLKIKKQAKLEFDGNPLQISPNDLGDFLLGCLSEQVTIEEGVTMGEVMNITFHLKDFVLKYYVEYYEQLNALIASGIMVEPISKVILFKKMVISPEGEMMIFPQIRTIKSSQQIAGYFDVPIEIDPKLDIVDEKSHLQSSSDIYTHFTLLDLLGAIFEEFKDYISTSAGTH